MLIFFPSLPFNPTKIDPNFSEERYAAGEAGFETALINTTALDERNYKKAVPKIHYNGPALLRTWMMRTIEYAQLHSAFSEEGIDLINKQKAYNFCHSLPSNISTLGTRTPETVVVPLIEYDFVDPNKKIAFLQYRLSKSLIEGPVIIKDYIKSEKHYWNEACFIPDPKDSENFRSVVNKFLELRGNRFTGGIVFRKFLKFEGYTDSKGFPKINEHRIFVYNRKPIYADQYWGNIAPGSKPDPKEFAKIISQIPSEFYTMDVARTQEGEWMIIELGDGQVAGLPETTNPQAFYRALKQSIHRN